MAFASNGKLYVVHRDGRLKVVSTETGYVVYEPAMSCMKRLSLPQRGMDLLLLKVDCTSQQTLVN